jgi:hypothetical protein
VSICIRRVIVIMTLCLAAPNGTAFAQLAQHGVTITVPATIGLRIVGAGSGPRDVVFDYAADPVAYDAAVNGTGVLRPTSTNRFDDIQVNSNRRGRWSVAVIATPLTYSGPASGGGIALEDITVTRGLMSGLLQNAIPVGGSAWYNASWHLTTTAQQIASRTGASGGWQSLGFNGLDYELRVQGNENPGSFTTTVTYLLTAP